MKNRINVFSLFLGSLLAISAHATPLDIKWHGGHELEACSPSARQCLNITMPTWVGTVRQVLPGNFVPGAAGSWLAVGKKKAVLCVLKSDAETVECGRVAVDLAGVRVRATPDSGGGIRWVFDAPGSIVSAEAVGSKLVSAVARASDYFSSDNDAGSDTTLAARGSTFAARSAVRACFDEATEGVGGGSANCDGSDNGDDDDDGDDDGGDIGGGDVGGGGGGGEGGGVVAIPLPVPAPPVVIITKPPTANPDPGQPQVPVPQPTPCSLFGIGCSVPAIPSKPAPQCNAAYSTCQQTCAKIYADNRDWLPGSGTDYASRMRVCIRDCMRSHGCENY